MQLLYRWSSAQALAPAAHRAMLVTSSDSCAATRGNGSANSSSSARARTAPRSASGRREYVRTATVLRQLLPTAFFATTAASRRTACALPDARVGQERALQPMLYPLHSRVLVTALDSPCSQAWRLNCRAQAMRSKLTTAQVCQASVLSLLVIRSPQNVHTTKVAQGHRMYYHAYQLTQVA